MGYQLGFVGLPNAGKSTLFNILTGLGIGAENYPFCTIDPNSGQAAVPDARLDKLAELAKSAKVIPSFMEFVDIAGLVEGASKGEGLGNQFLGHIRQVQAIAHITRAFEDSNIIHVKDRVSPLDDLQIIETELRLADIQVTEKALQKTQKEAKSGNKAMKERLALQESLLQHLYDETPLAPLLAENDALAELVSSMGLLTCKPKMVVANISEDQYHQNPYLPALQQWCDEQHCPLIPICVKLESEMADLSTAEKTAFLQEMEMEEPGLHRIIQQGYQLLGLETFFTVGPKEARAWTIKKNTLAPQAAGVIHSDFCDKFIRAEVISYTDFMEFGSEQACKQAGKSRLEGKSYVVQDGDILHIRAGA